MSFDTLKRRFTEEPVLLMPDHSKPFQIESDASKVATGAVLTQADLNGNDTRWPSYLRPLPTLNVNMKYTTENSWELFEHSRNGDITFKDQDTQL